MARIIIDAGHGGSARAGNSSAYGSRGPSGLLEKDVTLDIARHVVARLGGDAALTRTGDANLALGARAAHASRDGADVFVSIHANSGPPEMAGPETWVHPDAGADSHQLAGGIQRALERLAGRYGGSAESRRGPMAVLRPGAIGPRTAACLVEVDYLSNPRGEQRLGDPRERAAIGAAIAGAIQEHVGSRRYGQQPAQSGGSVRIPPPAVINQVGRAHGLVPSIRAGATDTSLGFGVRGATGGVRAVVHTTLPEGTSGSVTVCLRRGGHLVAEETFRIPGGLHMLPSHIHWNVGDGDYEIAFINGSGNALQVDLDLQWQPAAHQGRHGGGYGLRGEQRGWAEAAATPADAAVAAFAVRSGASAWHSSLTRAAVAARLSALLANPNLVDQGNLNLCGPAAFFHLWFHRNPLAAVNYAIALFETGIGRIGGLSIEPDADLRRQDYGAVASSSTPPADWMMLSALRDWENDTLDFEGTPAEDAAGITTPAELARWMQASAAYRTVTDDGNWVFTKGLPHALALAPSASRDVIMLINANIIRSAASGRKRSLLDSFPNHYIRLLDPVTSSGGHVTFRYWTWGHAPATATVPTSSFESNYYGSITGQV